MSEDNLDHSCGFWKGHTWGKWFIIEEGHITRMNNSVIGRVLTQKRECRVCGFSEINTQKVSTI